MTQTTKEGPFLSWQHLWARLSGDKVSFEKNGLLIDGCQMVDTFYFDKVALVKKGKKHDKI